MAESTNLTDLKSLLECSICLNRFQDPRVLPCLHSYCLECLKTYVSSTKGEGEAFNCPQCREQCIIPDADIGHFPKNFFVNAMKDIIQTPVLQKPNTAEASSSTSVLCKHHSEESGNKHGTAVVFCVQCDGHFCESCLKDHGSFDVTKAHGLVLVGDINPKVQMNKNPNCGLHQNHAINWYCDTCKLPACADCILESHKDHDTKKLSEVEGILKEEMLDVSKLAAKHIKYLQEQLADLNTNQSQMEEELNQTSKDISKAADSLCKTIRQREDALQEKLKKAKEVARMHFQKAKDDLETAVDNISILKCSAENLHLAPPEQAICTVVQAAIKKQQFLHQQMAPVRSVQLTNNTDTMRPSYNEMNTVGFLGTVDVDTSLESMTAFEAENISLRSPLTTYTLAYSGEYLVCGIAPIYNHLTCVAHSYDDFIRVYNDEGQLEKEIKIPGIKQIHGMITLKDNQGKLAIVDSKQRKVHFVTLCPAIDVTQYCTVDVPVVADHISMGCNGDLIIANDETAGYCVLNALGKVKNDLHVPFLGATRPGICVAQTKPGFVMCDSAKKKIHFTDANCHVLHSTDCVNPRCPVPTSWGHVVIVDYAVNGVKVFSETGKFLGNIHDVNGSITYPEYIYIDEAKRRLYVACGMGDDVEVRIYKYAPSDFQLLPVTHDVSKLTVNVRLVNL